MTETNTGSNGGAGQGGNSQTDVADPGQDGGSGKKTAAVLVAVISAMAIVIAAAIQILPALFNEDEKSSEGKVDACDLDRLENSGELWVRPPAQLSNSKLFAEKEPRVLTKVSADKNPGLSVRGQISLTVPAGQVLYLVRQPDRNTKDEYGNPGSHQYYPATPVTPDSDGCWEDGNRPLGYDGARGITEIYYLFLVSREQTDKFSKDRAVDGWDGYSPSQWQAVGAINVLEFRVPTIT